jgi:predicted DNA repair protein MutK
VASSLLTLLDEIATVLDDVAVMTKIATKKTVGVLGDDLALNAHQIAGVDPYRELLVVWAVAKGSMLNKAILVPAALLLSALLPWAVIPLMIIGGAFLCFEGVEKLAHKLLHSKAGDDAHRSEILRTLADPNVDLIAFERDKIKGAVRTDFVLSAEIIVISLGTVAKEAFAVQVGVLIAIAVMMTVGRLRRGRGHREAWTTPVCSSAGTRARAA